VKKTLVLALLVLLAGCELELGEQLRRSVTNPAPNEDEMEQTPPEAEPERGGVRTDVRFVFENEARRAWVVTEVEGAAGETQIGTRNPPLMLRLGKRYTFENPSGVLHPLELRGAGGEVLLGQGSNRGSFSGDSGVNAEISDDELSFTLTEPLAEALASYGCAVHHRMKGRVFVTE